MIARLRSRFTSRQRAPALAHIYAGKAAALGAAALAKLTQTAVARILDGRGYVTSGRLFSGDELLRLVQTLAAVVGTGDLLGRSRVRQHWTATVAAHGELPQSLAPAQLTRLNDQLREWYGVPTVPGGTVELRTPAQLTVLAEDERDTIPVQAGSPASPDPLLPEAALKYFRSLVPGLGVDPMRWGADLRRRVFTLAAATDVELAARVQRAIDETLATGEVSEGTDRVQQVLDRAGVSMANPSYSSLLIRTNAMDAYNQGAQDERWQPEVLAVFPVWLYSNPDDERSRPEHAERNGKYYPADVSFVSVRGSTIADAAFCRCVPIEIDKWEWDERKANGARIADGYRDVPSIRELEKLRPKPAAKPETRPAAQPAAIASVMSNDWLRATQIGDIEAAIRQAVQSMPAKEAITQASAHLGGYRAKSKGEVVELLLRNARNIKGSLDRDADVEVALRQSGRARPAQVQAPSQASSVATIYDRAANDPRLSYAEIDRFVAELRGRSKADVAAAAREVDVTPGSGDSKSAMLERIADSIKSRKARTERTHYGRGPEVEPAAPTPEITGPIPKSLRRMMEQQERERAAIRAQPQPKLTGRTAYGSEGRAFPSQDQPRFTDAKSASAALAAFSDAFRTIDPDTISPTVEEILRGLSASDAREAVKVLDITVAKTKAEAIAAATRVIRERRGAWDRAKEGSPFASAKVTQDRASGVRSPRAKLRERKGPGDAGYYGDAVSEPVQAQAPVSTAPPEFIALPAARLQAVFNELHNERVSIDALEQGVRDAFLGLTKDQALALAKHFDVSTAKTRTQAVEGVVRQIRERRGALLRVHV